MRTSIAAKFLSVLSHLTPLISINPFKMEDYLIQDPGLTSGCDAMNFGGDVVQEIDDNTWEGAPNLVLVDWSLNIDRCFPNLATFKEHTEWCAIEQGWEVGITRVSAGLLYIHCRSSIDCPFYVKAHNQAAGGCKITSLNNHHICLGDTPVSRARVASLPFLLRYLPRLVSFRLEVFWSNHS